MNPFGKRLCSKTVLDSPILSKPRVFYPFEMVSSSLRKKKEKAKIE